MLQRDALMLEALRQERQRFITNEDWQPRHTRPLQVDEVIQQARPSYGQQLADGFAMLSNE